MNRKQKRNKLASFLNCFHWVTTIQLAQFYRNTKRNLFCIHRIRLFTADKSEPAEEIPPQLYNYLEEKYFPQSTIKRDTYSTSTANRPSKSISSHPSKNIVL